MTQTPEIILIQCNVRIRDVVWCNLGDVVYLCRHVVTSWLSTQMMISLQDVLPLLLPYSALVELLSIILCHRSVLSSVLIRIRLTVSAYAHLIVLSECDKSSAELSDQRKRRCYLHRLDRTDLTHFMGLGSVFFSLSHSLLTE